MRDKQTDETSQILASKPTEVNKPRSCMTDTMGDFTFWISPWMRPKTETNH